MPFVRRGNPSKSHSRDGPTDAPGSALTGNPQFENDSPRFRGTQVDYQ